MCGIIGAVAKRDITPILLAGLEQLEYRGYDSVGLAVIDSNSNIQRSRVSGKIRELREQYVRSPLSGTIGIAHTRWATHGKPSIDNAHPHICRGQLALVHNGIIENHEILRQKQEAMGFEFQSETDTETALNAIYQGLEKQTQPDLLQGVFTAISQLEGAYALGIIHTNEPQRLIAVRKGSSLVIGVGDGEYYIASSVIALTSVTQRFVFMEEGDVADIQGDCLTIYDQNQQVVERPISISTCSADIADRGEYKHYMQKEIFSQPSVVAGLLGECVKQGYVDVKEFGQNADSILAQVQEVKIVACGTSYHAGLIAAYWMEELANVPCRVEIASEYRYRKSTVRNNTLFVSISQSGETADILAALQLAKQSNYLCTLAICNDANSALVRDSDLCFLTRSGPEIGVASTKTFTTQLVGLFLLVIALARHKGLSSVQEHELVKQLESLPKRLHQLFQFEREIKMMAQKLAQKQHIIFLGRGILLPIAMEGALKLKEISYIYAEAYAAGELKHGPLALVDPELPVVAVVPNNNILEKFKSNLQEVHTRGGKLYIFSDTTNTIDFVDSQCIIKINQVCDYMIPIIYTVPLQLLAYHVALIKGTDIDQPRNLAKSVTVE